MCVFLGTLFSSEQSLYLSIYTCKHICVFVYVHIHIFWKISVWLSQNYHAGFLRQTLRILSYFSWPHVLNCLYLQINRNHHVLFSNTGKIESFHIFSYWKDITLLSLLPWVICYVDIYTPKLFFTRLFFSSITLLLCVSYLLKCKRYYHWCIKCISMSHSCMCAITSLSKSLEPVSF